MREAGPVKLWNEIETALGQVWPDVCRIEAGDGYLPLVQRRDDQVGGDVSQGRNNQDERRHGDQSDS